MSPTRYFIVKHAVWLVMGTALLGALAAMVGMATGHIK